ncbi:hypothetical protein ASE51_09075 [Bacillus sp. Root147]|nr:hypothetical protein ASE51_09075 [Bacillus sp. Root147]
MNSAKSPAKKSWLETLIKNKDERKKVIFIFTISFLLVVAGLIYIPIYKHSLPLDSKIYEGNFTYFSGIITMAVLACLLVMGVKRYKRTDKKLHLKFAISFLVLFMIHATFS